jgi:hypothetical protein
MGYWRFPDATIETIVVHPPNAKCAKSDLKILYWDTMGGCRTVVISRFSHFRRKRLQPTDSSSSKTQETIFKVYRSCTIWPTSVAVSNKVFLLFLTMIIIILFASFIIIIIII